MFAAISIGFCPPQIWKGRNMGSFSQVVSVPSEQLNWWLDVMNGRWQIHPIATATIFLSHIMANFCWRGFIPPSDSELVPPNPPCTQIDDWELQNVLQWMACEEIRKWCPHSTQLCLTNRSHCSSMCCATSSKADSSLSFSPFPSFLPPSLSCFLSLAFLFLLLSFLFLLSLFNTSAEWGWLFHQLSKLWGL